MRLWVALFLIAASGCRGGGGVTTLVGHARGFMDGTAAQANFDRPSGITTDVDGTVYVADTYNHRIRAIAPDGAVTTLAGSGRRGRKGGGYQDGPGLAARFRYPRDLATDGRGHLYVADTNNCRVRVVDLRDPAHPVTTMAGSGQQGCRDGAAGEARFLFPWGLACDGATGDVYVSDTYNHRIRRVAAKDHRVTTLAGGGKAGLKGGGYEDGLGEEARFFAPRGLACDQAQHRLYVADASNQAIRCIDLRDPAHAAVTTLGGTITDQRRMNDGDPLVYPTGLLLSHSTLYAVDSGTNMIYSVAGNGQHTTLAGHGDTFWSTSPFNQPTALTLDAHGHLLITDTGNDRIRVVS